MQRAGMTEVSALPESGYVWGSGAGPESLSPLPVAGDVVDLDSAMINALKAESGAVAFYEHIAQSSSEAEVRMLAGTFAVEERAHVLALERFLGRKPY